MKLLGIKLVHYVHFMETYTRFILCFITNNNEKKQIIINNINNKDKSLYIKTVLLFDEFSLIPYDLLELPDLDLNNIDTNIDLNNIIYEFINIYIFKYNSFTKTVKYKDKRPIWFFGGSCNKAKKYISSKTNISKFNLDEHNFLPTLIECDIIVMDNNEIYNINDIKKRCIGHNEFIKVNFEEKITPISHRYIFYKKKYVYIFIGTSNLGKSYIANSLEGLSIYEIDSNINLPDKLDANIIIIGGKNNIDINDIISKYYGNYTFFYVDFNRC
jgi:hypothetical protein